MKSQHDKHLFSLKKDHSCELQKFKISSSCEEDTYKYQYEEKLTNLQIALKMKDEKAEEMKKHLYALKDQIEEERQEQAQTIDQMA